MMVGEYEFIRSSEYKLLVDSLNGLYTTFKLMNIKIDPMLVKFHDQVEGDFGWNIFIGNCKFNLGLRRWSNNKLIIDGLDKNGAIENIMDYLHENEIDNYEFKNKTIGNDSGFAFVIPIEYIPDKNSVTHIVKLVQISVESLI